MNAPDLVARGLARRHAAVAAQADRLAALRALAWRDPPAPMAAPPRITPSTTNVSTIASGETIAHSDRRLTFAHGVPVPGSGAPYNTAVANQWITTPSGPNAAGCNWAIRFVTDAPQFELVVGDWSGTSQFFVTVDGQPLARAGSHVAMPNAGGTRYIRVDFGADSQTVVCGVAVASAGSGYAPGDALTIAGGTHAGVPMTVVVTGVDGGGGVTALYVRDRGDYTAAPGAGAASTTPGAGTGATFNVTAVSPAAAGHTTRKVRRIAIFSAGGRIVGLRVPALSVVRPWPVAGPRLFVMLDSYNDTVQAFPAGGYPWRLAQRIGVEDVWLNGRGGTGFLATNGGTQSVYRDRLGDFAARLPDRPETPAILLTQASINDASPADAALQAEVEAYWRQFFASREYRTLFAVQTGILRSSGATPADSKHAAVRAGFLAAQAAFDPQGRRSAFVETRGSGYDLLTAGGKAGATTGAGNTDHWMHGDGAHPHQAGHDFLGDMLAADLLAAIRGWTA